MKTMHRQTGVLGDLLVSLSQRKIYHRYLPAVFAGRPRLRLDLSGVFVVAVEHVTRRLGPLQNGSRVSRRKL